LILPPAQYWVRSTDHSAPFRCALGILKECAFIIQQAELLTGSTLKYDSIRQIQSVYSLIIIIIIIIIRLAFFIIFVLVHDYYY
jgi:hypothetical protein